MDKVIIRANFVSSSCENGVAVVGFADDDQKPSAYLILQQETPREGQGRELYYIELCGQEHGSYGGISKCEISETSLFFTLDPQQTRIPAKTIFVMNETNDSQWADACLAVKKMFEATDVLVTNPCQPSSI